MEKGTNLVIYETKVELARVINESKLPIAVIRQIVEELSGEITVLEKRQIEQERKEFIEAQKEGERDGNISQENVGK